MCAHVHSFVHSFTHTVHDITSHCFVVSVYTQGIASRLGIPWNLADKFAHAAKTALECGEEGCALPIYAKIAPVKLGREAPRLPTNPKNRRRFREVRDAFRLVRQLAKEWALGRAWELLPNRGKQWLVERELRRIKAEEAAEEAEAAARQQRAVDGDGQEGSSGGGGGSSSS